MPDDRPAADATGAADEAAADATDAATARDADDASPVDRRRLDDVFGEVLPETTSDERDQPPPADASGNDEWLRANRPPHH